MARIYGRRCLLTLEVDGEPFALPYAEETVRSAWAGTTLPYPSRTEKIEGCFITRLDGECIAPLFRLLVVGRRFALVQRQGASCRRYAGLTLMRFELYAENGGAVYVKGEVAGSDGATVSDCGAGEALPWTARRTLIFRGRGADCRMPDGLIHRIRLRARPQEGGGYELYLHSALSDVFFPVTGETGTVRLRLSPDPVAYLVAQGCVAVNDLRDVSCGNVVLVRKRLAADSLTLEYGAGGAMKEILI